jgi:hypothetical protein
MSEPRTLADMQQDDGPPLRLADLEALTGLSRRKLLEDIRCGYLRAAKTHPEADNAHYIVAHQEARRYLQAMQLICITVVRTVAHSAT